MKNKKQNTNKITRKEAIKKVGKYAALTAATMLILTPKNAAAASPASAPTAPDRWERPIQ